MLSKRETIGRLVTLHWGVLCLLMVGCGDIEFLGVDRPSGSTRSSSPPVQPTQKPHSSNDVVKRQETSLDTARENKPLFYRLILHNETIPMGEQSGMKHIKLTHASARDVGELLSILYMPTGPTGTEKRYTLIYESPVIWEVAAKCVDVLDIPAINEISAARDNRKRDDFNQGIGLIYGATKRTSQETKRYRLARESLTKVLQSKDQTRARRWMAGMIAGSIADKKLIAYDEAQQHYIKAETEAESGSIEQMSAQYARACVLIKNGKPAAAKDLLTKLTTQFGKFRKTEVYERARKIQADLNL
ncbi:MAG: hypothetical protein JSV03_13675 [Planctomycetota bacterium]|nr:MAG: hypothetical protein JSV03_13675 [Planctomycetota bacterium]